MGYQKGPETAWTIHLLGLDMDPIPFHKPKCRSRPLILTILPPYFPCQSVHNSQPSNTELLIILPSPHTTLPLQVVWFGLHGKLLSSPLSATPPIHCLCQAPSTVTSSSVYFCSFYCSRYPPRWNHSSLATSHQSAKPLNADT